MTGLKGQGAIMDGIIAGRRAHVWWSGALLEREEMPAGCLRLERLRASTAATALCVATPRGAALVRLEASIDAFLAAAACHGVPVDADKAEIADIVHRVVVCNRLRAGGVRLVAGLPQPSWADPAGRPIFAALPVQDEPVPFVVRRGALHPVAGAAVEPWLPIVRRLARAADIPLAPLSVGPEQVRPGASVVVCSADGIHAAWSAANPVARKLQAAWRHVRDAECRLSASWLDFAGVGAVA